VRVSAQPGCDIGAQEMMVELNKQCAAVQRGLLPDATNTSEQSVSNASEQSVADSETCFDSDCESNCEHVKTFDKYMRTTWRQNRRGQGYSSDEVD
jgi:hypothetical protein